MIWIKAIDEENRREAVAGYENPDDRIPTRLYQELQGRGLWLQRVEGEWDESDSVD